MHDWSEKDFDWKGLDDAGHLIVTLCRTYGRTAIYYKEKYGTARIHVYFGNISLHTLIYPSYMYNRFHKVIQALDNKYIAPVLQYCFETVFMKWQYKVYRYAYAQALKKHPHLRDEILRDCEHPELVDGGREVHDKYWTQL